MSFGNEETERWTVLENENVDLRAENVALKDMLAKTDQPLERALFTADRLLDDLGLSVTDRQRVEYVRREIREARALLDLQRQIEVLKGN
jgi:uncharacterized metal-binding protein YceD (DUF177 family)